MADIELPTCGTNKSVQLIGTYHGNKSQNVPYVRKDSGLKHRRNFDYITHPPRTVYYPGIQYHYDCPLRNTKILRNYL